MKNSPWFSCRDQPPVNACNGKEAYEVRLWPGGFEREMPYRCKYVTGKWFAFGRPLFGSAVPGWSHMDQWRGIVKGKK